MFYNRQNIAAHTHASQSNEKLPNGFVYLADIDPTIEQEVRYAGSNNFMGRPIKGYEKACIILTVDAAKALAVAQADLKANSNNQYTLRVYDGYRPQQAVDAFCQWSEDRTDTTMQNLFYPHIKDKKQLFQKGYVAKKSGHTRGSTVDLTIAYSNNNNLMPLDMGSAFDLFDPISHYDAPNLSETAQANRKYLRDLMVKHGFSPYKNEWWHFTLKNEPFPHTYFDFPIK